MEPHGQARGTSMFSAKSAEAYPPAHKASEGYPFRIHPRLKPWSSAKADKGSLSETKHNIRRTQRDKSVEAKLASLAKKGMVRLPLKKGKLPPFKSVKATGKPASEIIIEDRR